MNGTGRYVRDNLSSDRSFATQHNVCATARQVSNDASHVQLRNIHGRSIVRLHHRRAHIVSDLRLSLSDCGSAFSKLFDRKLQVQFRESVNDEPLVRLLKRDARRGQFQTAAGIDKILLICRGTYHG